MICPYCHQEHPDGYKFCPNTGNIIEHQFKACTNKKCTEFEKHILPLESKFCPNCGHPIDTLVSNNTTKNEDVLTFDINGVSFSMIKIEAGSFMMGATEEQLFATDNEKPVHKVTFAKDFYIGKNLVTQELWKEVMKDNPSYFGESGEGLFVERWEELPVDSISWNECMEFINMLNSILREKLNGKKFRLPTEAEWEFAARGGNKSRGYLFPGSNNIDEVAWYGDWKYGCTHPIGEKKANELGLHDMAGNVCEYCQDGLGDYHSQEQIDPLNISNNPYDGCNCIIRGGSFLSVMKHCIISHREDQSPNDSDFYNGIRICLS